jgi:signal peptidase I
MTPELARIGMFCRIYSVLLYAYPRDFRRQYGIAMQQLFRDRCRDVVRARGRLPMLRFAVHLATDWLTTTVRERAAAVWSAGRKRIPRAFVTEWAVTIAIYLFASTTLVQAYVSPTASMEGTVLVGDHMLVDRVTFAEPGSIGRHVLPYREPRRGDIVVFLYPEDVRQTYIKRVIGVPGDRIRLDNRQVIRNGRRLVEPYTQHIPTYPDTYRDDFPVSPGAGTTPRGRDMFEHHVRNGEAIVPSDTLFVLVVGKPLMIYWSYDAPTADLEGWSVSHLVDLAEHFFTRTRWDRMLSVPRSEPAQEDGGAR